jgi:hypothetical protein
MDIHHSPPPIRSTKGLSGELKLLKRKGPNGSQTAILHADDNLKAGIPAFVG